MCYLYRENHNGRYAETRLQSLLPRKLSRALVERKSNMSTLQEESQKVTLMSITFA